MSDNERIIPEYLIKQYPYLKGVPYEIWVRFWPFPNLPGLAVGTFPEAIEWFASINKEPLSQELKQLKWTNLIMEYRERMLLSEEEKNRYLSWEF